MPALPFLPLVLPALFATVSRGEGAREDRTPAVGDALRGPAAAQDCGRNQPAAPVPEQRDGVTLWPTGFRPVAAAIDAERDSTSWVSTTIPGAWNGQELFQAVVGVGDYLYTVYNAGVQVWALDDGTRANDPRRVAFADGWTDGFLAFPSTDEQDFYVDDVAAIEVGEDVVVVASGKHLVGPSFWRHRPGLRNEFEQLYQHVPSAPVGTVVDVEAFALSMAGGVRAFAVAASRRAIDFYDLDAALRLRACRDDDGNQACAGVHLGKLSGVSLALSVTVAARDDAVYVGTSDGNVLPGRPGAFELWRVPDPADPSVAQRVMQGLGSDSRDPVLFHHADRDWVAAVERIGDAPQPAELRIYDLTGCLSATGCQAPDEPTWATPVDALGVPMLTHSVTGAGTPVLYYGVQRINMSGARVEGLFDLTELPGGIVTEVTAGGGRYTDPCNGEEVDYWGDYYDRNAHGLNAFSPRRGVFVGSRFYRAGVSVFDVHRWDEPERGSDESGDSGGTDDGGLSSAEAGDAGVSDTGTHAETGASDAADGPTTTIGDSGSSGGGGFVSGAARGGRAEGCGCHSAGESGTAGGLACLLALCMLPRGRSRLTRRGGVRA